MTDEAPQAAAAIPDYAADAKLKTAIGLPETASANDIIHTLLQLVGSSIQTADEATEAAAADAEEIVTNRLAPFSALITDETRPYWREQMLLNREGATAALSAISAAAKPPAAVPPPVAPAPPVPLANRIDPDPARPLAEVLQPTAPEARAAAIRNRTAELRAANPRLSYSDAFIRAEKEIQK